MQLQLLQSLIGSLIETEYAADVILYKCDCNTVVVQ